MQRPGSLGRGLALITTPPHPLPTSVYTENPTPRERVCEQTIFWERQKAIWRTGVNYLWRGLRCGEHRCVAVWLTLVLSHSCILSWVLRSS